MYAVWMPTGCHRVVSVRVRVPCLPLKLYQLFLGHAVYYVGSYFPSIEKALTKCQYLSLIHI